MTAPESTAPGELSHLDGVAQADLIRRGEVTATELVDAAIAAAERWNPTLNAIIHPRHEAARAEAAAVDAGGPAAWGPFAGVPMVIKDLGCAQAGEPMHFGTRLMRQLGYRAPEDSYLYRRLRRAGFVSIGRTNVPELGTIISTESLAYGACRNPWNPAHSTGGSSGGSAAAVAAGIVAIGHAGDGGGSIRIPASACGLVGLKPSRGRISSGPAVGESWAGCTTDGVVTRTVRDTAAALDVMIGYEPGDPYIAPPLAGPLSAEVGADPGRLRIGVFSGRSLGDAVGPECVAAAEGAGRLLESLGHHVEEAWPDALTADEFRGAFSAVVMACSAADKAWFESIAGFPVTDEHYEAHNLLYAEIGAAMSAAQYLDAVTTMHAWSRRMLEWWHPLDGRPGFDLLVSPVLAKPPAPIGYISPTNPQLTEHVLEYLLFTAQFNSTGQPAVSLPLHWTAGGLPVGVQLVGGFAAEPLLVRVAAQLEAAAPWADRRPTAPR